MGAAFAQSPLTFSFEREVNVPATQTIPRWSGDRLVSIEGRDSNSPVILAIDQDGNTERIPFHLPDNSRIQSLYDATAGNDGELVVLGQVPTNDQNRVASFISWISPDRKRQTVFRPQMNPDDVAIAADGAIWAIEGSILRRFDAAGKLLSSIMANGLRPSDTWASFNLRTSRSTVGFFTRASQYVEFSLDGKQLGVYDAPSGADWAWTSTALCGLGGPAVSEDNQVVLCTTGTTRKDFQMRVLDRGARAWTPFSLSGSTSGAVDLLGFDGTTLLIHPKQGVLTRWQRVETRSQLPN